MSRRVTRSASCRRDIGDLFRSGPRAGLGRTSIFAGVVGIAGLATLLAPVTPMVFAQSAEQGGQPASWSHAWSMRPIQGRAMIRAERISTWSDADGVQRVRAESDVIVEVGPSTFRANRAAAWVKREVQGDGTSHLALYFVLEDVGSSTDAPQNGAVVTTDRLLVKAVVATNELVVESVDPVAPARPKDAQWQSLETYGLAGLERSLSPRDDDTAMPTFVFRPGDASRSDGTTQAPRRYDASKQSLSGEEHRIVDSAAKATNRSEIKSVPPATVPKSVDAKPTTKPAEPTATVQNNVAPPQSAKPQQTQTNAASSAVRSQTQTQATSDKAANLQTQQPATPQTTEVKAEQKQPETQLNASPLFAKSGRLTFAAGHISIVQGNADNGQPAEPMIIISDGLTLLYNDAGTNRLLQAKAQRGVVFLAPGTGTASVDFGAEQVLGVYLEGDVTISDGDMNLRAREVYYDIASNRAVMLDATFWFVEQSRNLPLYIRAKEIRQESTRQFKAKDVRFSNTAFLNPELSVGVSTATLERRDKVVTTDEVQPDGTPKETRETYSHLVADNVTLRVNDVPFFWWPTYSGDPASPLIRDIRVESRSGSGLAGRVRWNATNLLGLSRIDGLNVDLQTDYYLERGIALGGRGAWETRRHIGGAFVYGLLNDEGEDVLKTGERLERDGEFRGIVMAEDRFRVNDLWTVLTEGAYISDETFVDAFFEQAGETRREFASRLRAERTQDSTQLTIEAKGTFNDFTANEWLLESQGYAVNKLPEVKYTRLADDLLPGAPGMLTYFSEYRASRIALAFDEIAMQDRGFVNSFQSQRVFGVDPSQSAGDLLRSAGLDESAVTRLDTRHEFVSTFDVDNLRLMPFVVGRLTLYDNEFRGYSATPDGNDELRTWAGAGVRASTTIERIHDAVDSRFLDVHRLRHIIQPNITVWGAGTNVEGGDLPVYDSDVEALSDGAAVRLGLSQTLLTKRGDVAQWHDTTLLQLNTDFVFSTDDTDPTTPIGRFFDARPERSALGNYFVGDAAYRLTDATSLTGSMIFDFDTHQPDVTTAGILFQHEPGFSALAETRFLNAQDSSILALVGSFEISDKYSVVVSPNYSMNEGEFQSVYARVNRRFASLLAALSINYNNISGETSFGFVIQPYGARGAGGVEGLGSDLPAAYGGGAGGF